MWLPWKNIFEVLSVASEKIARGQVGEIFRGNDDVLGGQIVSLHISSIHFHFKENVNMY